MCGGYARSRRRSTALPGRLLAPGRQQFGTSEAMSCRRVRHPRVVFKPARVNDDAVLPCESFRFLERRVLVGCRRQRPSGMCIRLSMPKWSFVYVGGGEVVAARVTGRCSTSGTHGRRAAPLRR
jgi:hypothetical protein